MRTRTTGGIAALVLLAAAALTGCSSAAEAESPSASAPAAETVTVTDAWVKTADSGMSAAFGVIENTGDDDVVVTAATTDAAEMIELHETVENEAGELIMREIDGGFTIPAGGELTLEPGGNHLMLMGITGPIAAGDEVGFTLTFSDDSTLDIAAPAKDYAGANETYEGDGDTGGMDMGDGDMSDDGDVSDNG